MPEAAEGVEILNVAQDFPAVSTAEWEAAIAKDLKGADYEKKLVWRTEEGLAVRPYYRNEALEGIAPFAYATGRSWEIAQDVAIASDAIRGDLLHEAGAHAVQELGYAMAEGVERLATSAGPVEFVFAAGPATFVEIAKLRAARLMWAQVLAAFGQAGAMRLHVRTPRRNKSSYDRYTNLLRVTTEAFAAAVGGCDSLDVEPFGFDEHLALNVQRILKEEAHLDAVSDPAGGSYYVEALTDTLAREAWKLLQSVESAGGFAAASDLIEKDLAATRTARAKAYSSRKRALVGVNNCPDTTEKTPGVEIFVGQAGSLRGGCQPPPACSESRERRVDNPPQAASLPHGDIHQNLVGGTRIAEPFEAIRRRTVEHATATGRYPKVLLLKRGDVKMKGARANFCFNFFGCAGFDLVEADHYENSDADLIVLCSSDAEYLELAKEVCAAVKVPVIVAGNPKELVEALTTAGVAGFVHVFSDAVETLTLWQDRLGIRSAQ